MKFFFCLFVCLFVCLFFLGDNSELWEREGGSVGTFMCIWGEKHIWWLLCFSGYGEALISIWRAISLALALFTQTSLDNTPITCRSFIFGTVGSFVLEQTFTGWRALISVFKDPQCG